MGRGAIVGSAVGAGVYAKIGAAGLAICGIAIRLGLMAYMGFFGLIGAFFGSIFGSPRRAVVW